MLSRKSWIRVSPRVLERCVPNPCELELIWQLPGRAMAHTTLAPAWDQALAWTRVLERCVLNTHKLELIWQLPGRAMAHTTLDHKPALAWDQAPHWNPDVCRMNAQSRDILRKV